MKPSDYNVTKKEDTIAGSDGICIFVFGTQDEFRDLCEFLIWGIRANSGECFFFPSWMMDWGWGRFALTKVAQRERLVWGKK